MTASCNLNGRNNIGAPFSGTLWVQYNQGSNISLVSQVARVTVSASTIRTLRTSITNNSYGGNTPSGIAYNPSNGYMYVANYYGNSVSVLSGTSIVTTISGLSNPQRIAYDPSNGCMYVTNNGGTTVSVISGTTIVATITVGSGPTEVAYNPGNGYMYVTNHDSGTVSVISGTTVMATISWGVLSLGSGLRP